MENSIDHSTEENLAKEFKADAVMLDQLSLKTVD
jgi:hypothetical protein